MKKIILAILLVMALALTACGNQTAPATEEAAKEEPTTQVETEKTEEKAETAETEGAETGELETIKIGVTPVPHAEIMEFIKEDMAAKGINLELVEFNDYVVPNIALNDGEIDANFFQHDPYFQANKEQNSLDLVSIGVVHIEPIALYSAKYESIEELPDGANIIIPNDATNGARALLLLEKAGLIKLEDPSNINATEEDITENPKNLTFTPMDAAAIPRAYADADGAVINSNFAISAGLNPITDGLIMEEGDSPYANLVAVRAGEEKEEKFAKLMEALHSEKVREFLLEKYEGAVVPAF